MSEEGLDKTVRETIISVLEKHGAERIAIFGSYARGEVTDESDIDILVRFSSPKSLFDLVRIEDELKSVLNLKVDLITEKSVSPYLAGAIRHDELVIYKE
jgi:predicted nucleotidyltransferase